MIKEISEALSILQSDDNVNVIVVVSEISNIFCAGADIKQFNKTTFDYEYGVRVEPLHIVN